MDNLTLTITAAQWAEISAALRERPMETALSVLRACQAQVDQQQHGQCLTPIGYGKGPGTPAP